MDINSILMTDSPINKDSGGGVVSLNILETMQKVSKVRLILSGQHFTDSKYDDKIQSYCIKPEQFGYSDPFFQDYFSKTLIEEIDPSSIEFAVSYGCPWGATFEKLKKDFFCKTIADLAPHNIDLSREEHIRLSGTYPYPHLNNSFLLKYYLKHLRLADKVVVHSHVSAEYIEKEAKLNEPPSVLPHGCYPPAETQRVPDEFSVGYFGYLSADKGFIYLYNAWLESPLHKKHMLVLGGKGSESIKLKDEEKKYIKALGVIENTSDFYNCISVGIFPTITEGFGICGLECLAHGRPIITTSATGVSELMEDGKQGFIIPIRDVKAIEEKMQYFYDNEDELKRMGKEASELANKYTWDIVKKLYVKEFESVL